MKLLHLSNKLSTLIAFLLILLYSGVVLAVQPNDLRGIGIIARDNVTGTNREVKLYRQMHAVIIGIDKYPNISSDRQLDYAVKDAQGVEKVLRDQYSFDNIYTLYNEKATRNGIMAVLQGTLSNVHEDDAVFIFFAGHGATQKEKLTGGDLGYLIPFDGTSEREKMYLNISMAQLRDEVAKIIPARHVFYVIDACYSGTLLAQRTGGKDPSHDYSYLQEITKEPVRQVLTAGTDKQTVLDGGPKGHSVFTGRFIEKLEVTEDYITAAEIGKYVKRRVASDAQTRGHVQTPRDGAFYGLGDFVFVPSANKKALEIEKEAKHLEEELVKLKEQEHQMDAWKVRQQKEEIERQQKTLATKQKIEELRRQKIAEAKKREEEQVQMDLDAKKQSGEKKKQEEERLAHLRMEVEKRKQALPEVSAGELSVDEAISRIKRLQAELSDIEIKISEAVNQVGMDYEPQLREADASPRDEFETTADYQKRVAASEEKKKKIHEEQTQAEEDVRTQFFAGIKTDIDNLLKAEYPIPSKDISITLGQYDADAGEMPLQIHWTHNQKENKTGGYLKIEGKDARLLKEHKEFLRANGGVTISPSLQPFLLRIEVIDDADKQRVRQVYFEFVPLIGLQWAKDAGGAGGQRMTWDEAIAYVRKLRLGGYSDWRLPTKEELESLLTYCKGKGIQVKEGRCTEYYNKIGFKNVQSYCWSSTSYAYDNDYAWLVNMNDGEVGAYGKSGVYYVWPVRSGQ